MARAVILKPSPSAIRTAGLAVKQDGVVAFPTETVYGLAANAFSARAAKKIFSIKGRPENKPLLILIASPKDLSSVARSISPSAKKLMRAFWPGALTIIFKKTGKIPRAVSGGTDTVAVRLSPHPTARALLRAAGTPITATSANSSGGKSHRSARAVFLDIGERGISLILNGGRTKGGASTIVDATQEIPVIVRKGAISARKIKNALT